MKDCGCDTDDGLLGKNTDKCITNDCNENTDLVALTLAYEKYKDKLIEFENVFDEFKEGVMELCASEHSRFEQIFRNTDILTRNEEDCCDETNDKLIEIGNLVAKIDIAHIIL